MIEVLKKEDNASEKLDLLNIKRNAVYLLQGIPQQIKCGLLLPMHCFNELMK